MHIKQWNLQIAEQIWFTCLTVKSTEHSGVVDLDFLETKGGIHETTKTPGLASIVKSTGQYSGLDLRWDLQISEAKWIYIYYINVMC